MAGLHMRRSHKHLDAHPFQHLDIDSEHFKKIEKYVVVLYDKTSSLSFVNEAREELFCRKRRSIDNIPLLKMHYFNN